MTLPPLVTILDDEPAIRTMLADVLEDALGTDLRAPGFPASLTD